MNDPPLSSQPARGSAGVHGRTRQLAETLLSVRKIALNLYCSRGSAAASSSPGPSHGKRIRWFARHYRPFEEKQLAGGPEALSPSSVRRWRGTQRVGRGGGWCACGARCPGARAGPERDARSPRPAAGTARRAAVAAHRATDSRAGGGGAGPWYVPPPPARPPMRRDAVPGARRARRAPAAARTQAAECASGPGITLPACRTAAGPAAWPVCACGAAASRTTTRRDAECRRARRSARPWRYCVAAPCTLVTALRGGH